MSERCEKQVTTTFLTFESHHWSWPKKKIPIIGRYAVWAHLKINAGDFENGNLHPPDLPYAPFVD